MYSPLDTIAAISTPRGHGGIGIIRLSGPLALEISSKIFFPSSKSSLENIKPNVLVHGWARDEKNRPVDEVMRVFMRAPHSYTAEDIVELSAHGGAAVLDKLLGLCLKYGARLAAPGEFTLRAFVNGRMDLSRAEAVADIITGKTELAARAAAVQLTGAFYEKLNTFKNFLLEFLSRLEASIDHPDEDIRFWEASSVKENLLAIIGAMEGLLAGAQKGRLLREGMRIAVIGRPNSGKSSVLNALLQRERAIVSDIPGTTRDTIEESVDICGIPAIIVDTAGLRSHTLDPIEKIGHARTVENIKNADMIFWIFDAADSIGESERHIAGILNEMNAARKTVPVLNKIDLAPRLEEGAINGLVEGLRGPVRISALKAVSLESLEQAVADFSGINTLSLDEPVLTNSRHSDILKRAKNSCEEALQSVSGGESDEFTAFHVREALNIIGELTGETSTEDILENIFSKFCIGK
ncbi:MAG: tRNA uridine-5-carboxymethylaminomethyl(34) synthesis GTPase MnmE [Elusimicrobia bacterium RIFOXYA1_FULL_47_7]|nr:MAG: tRNA uridine-5-carboxymethylaminomethyl(34) synthesis GTPase MnmE [Elusimicrobia bacterium RIFOXYA12_FULL_49_49]OGS09746.1 MAG: tRNA uridine-5-carboxymethylaminomethyl(34) synthesis GTPase MnmE [Elusimicrobia bacterium RIFOXYA1_FULL_47_7]OGS10769.1 MAG: tRNA uridine-5-carboxymethylaminomethyl(34) synthesis GTPase MnmE [Elusimicrobia bacterium RIFOXYB1_FULL_48_9]OGS16483.1 MAG: tRNA uridine-5-carboxymethylaminomethyl(34) synthesis GTPase MnmE [Elusimicrobia bacterium RIFOXYA2_FULL_47_53]